MADIGDGLASQASGIAVFGQTFEEILMKRSAKIISSNILALGILSAAAAGVAHAAPADSGSNSYMRAVLATSQDIAEGKRVAEASCASCHGLSGVAKAKDKDMANICLLYTSPSPRDRT